MNRIAAALNESKNSVQATLATGNPESCAGFQSELRQPNNIGKIESAKTLVVRNIEKYGVLLNGSRGHRLSDLDYFPVLKAAPFSLEGSEESR